MYKQLSLKLDQALFNQVDKLSKQTGASKNEVIRQALKQFIFKQERVISK